MTFVTVLLLSSSTPVFCTTVLADYEISADADSMLAAITATVTAINYFHTHERFRRHVSCHIVISTSYINVKQELSSRKATVRLLRGSVLAT